MQVEALVWSTTWALTTVVGWGELDRHTQWAWTTNALCASAAALGLLLWSLAGAPMTRRQWKTLRRT